MYKPNRENWVIEMTVSSVRIALVDKKGKSDAETDMFRLWFDFLDWMEPERKLFLQYDDYVFFFGE
jgi:hypothetical protein